MYICVRAAQTLYGWGWERFWPQHQENVAGKKRKVEAVALWRTSAQENTRRGPIPFLSSDIRISRLSSCLMMGEKDTDNFHGRALGPF
jgi:hypothetical protein